MSFKNMDNFKNTPGSLLEGELVKNSADYKESKMEKQNFEEQFSGNVFLQQGLQSYWEKRRDDTLMLTTIHDDTWNMLNMQHITLNFKRGLFWYSCWWNLKRAEVWFILNNQFTIQANFHTEQRAPGATIHTYIHI